MTDHDLLVRLLDAAEASPTGFVSFDVTLPTGRAVLAVGLPQFGVEKAEAQRTGAAYVVGFIAGVRHASGKAADWLPPELAGAGV